jgi:NTP pyrophosphatase (non-canonical NTP hydrolase)
MMTFSFSLWGEKSGEKDFEDLWDREPDREIRREPKKLECCGGPGRTFVGCENS